VGQPARALQPPRQHEHESDAWTSRTALGIMWGARLATLQLSSGLRRQEISCTEESMKRPLLALVALAAGLACAAAPPMRVGAPRACAPAT
jgi:hypothetical protein